MKQNFLSLTTTIVAISTIISTQAFAASSAGVSVGLPASSGNGCPSGTVSAAVSPDNSALSVIFSAFQVEAGGITGRNKDRRDCKVSIPLTVAPGRRLIMVKADYRGYHNVPNGARSTFRHAYSLSDSLGYRRGNTVSKFFNGPLDEDYLVEGDSGSTVISGCGSNMTLNIAASVGVQTNRALASTLATVDSVDVTSTNSGQAGLTYYLIYQSCP